MEANEAYLLAVDGDLSCQKPFVSATYTVGSIAGLDRGIIYGSDVVKLEAGEKRLAVIGASENSFVVGENVLVKGIVGKYLLRVEEELGVLLKSPKISADLVENSEIFLESLLRSASVFDLVSRISVSSCKVADVEGRNSYAACLVLCCHCFYSLLYLFNVCLF